MKKLITRMFVVGGLSTALTSLPLHAITTLDLTAGGTGTLNGAIFTTSSTQSTGSGVIDPFVRIQDNGSVIEGYNATVRPVMPQVNTSLTFTHDIQVGSVGSVVIGGTTYLEFLLDINQTNANPQISLDKVQIFTRPTALSAAALLTDLTGASGIVNRFNLDAGASGDAEVLLNYSLNSGSGSGDMFMYVPRNLFGLSTDYLYLYSMFGSSTTTVPPGPWGNNDGYEEWATRTPTGPGPGPSVPDGGLSVMMLGGVLVVVGLARRSLMS